MKAIICAQWGGPETLQLQDVAMPEPGPKQVRVRVAAAGAEAGRAGRADGATGIVAVAGDAAGAVIELQHGMTPARLTRP